MSRKDFIKIVKDHKYCDKCGFIFNYSIQDFQYYDDEWFIMVKNDTPFFESFFRYVLKHMNDNQIKITRFKEKKFLWVIFSQTSYSTFDSPDELNGFINRANLSETKKEELWEKILNL